jgi:hypothetical protein
MSRKNYADANVLTTSPNAIPSFSGIFHLLERDSKEMLIYNIAHAPIKTFSQQSNFLSDIMIQRD